MSKNKAPVVIQRKDKRIGKGRHALAFMLTGGTSSVYTAGKATTNAMYNARTRKLQAEYEESQEQETAPAPPRQETGYTGSEADPRMVARKQLGLVGIPWRQLTKEQKREVQALEQDIKSKRRS